MIQGQVSTPSGPWRAPAPFHWPDPGAGPEAGLLNGPAPSANIVTAAGEVVLADADRHPGLYGALRGGTGNFGVVTAVTMRFG